MMRKRQKDLGLGELIAIALGGMVGGGIFSILGIAVTFSLYVSIIDVINTAFHLIQPKDSNPPINSSQQVKYYFFNTSEFTIKNTSNVIFLHFLFLIYEHFVDNQVLIDYII